MTAPAVGDTPTAQADHGADYDIVLAAEHVSVDYEGDRTTHAVRDVSLALRRGEVLGIAGESGCGKSTLAYALTRLLQPPARLASGSVKFWSGDGSPPVDLASIKGEELRTFRWRQISMVFQSAMNALNPVTSVAHQFDDIFRAHSPEMTSDARRERAGELLSLVDIDPARLSAFAYELSGGMRQRVMIAMALALDPQVVIMDEPTTALDVVVQREILDEIQRLREQLGFSVIFITHDLSLLLEVADRLAIMYAGEIVELAPTADIQRAPAHPYTFGLLSSFPDLRGIRRDLHGISGSPPNLAEPVVGCAFSPRCAYTFTPCPQVTPVLRRLAAPPGSRTIAGKPADLAGGTESSRQVACHLHDPEYCASAPAELTGAANPMPAGQTL
jgi:peptide/nickel transport system ATP-binding protein